MTNAVEVRHLSKSIEGSPILNDICMNVRQGEVYGFQIFIFVLKCFMSSR